MKKIIFIALACIYVCPSFAQTQTTTVANYYCHIDYVYDNAGNRTNRSYNCADETIIGNGNGNGGSNMPLQASSKQSIVKSIVFPNPSNGIFVVSTNIDVEFATVRVINVNGQVIKQFEFEGREQQFDMRTLAIGNYFIQVLLPNQIQTHRLEKNE
jgi:hypothetical protein